MTEVGRATAEQDRRAVFRFWYSVYVEEMGRFQSTADHEHRELRDPEDASSWIFFARDGEHIVGACRFSFGADGFSDRQVRQYSLRPFLEEMDPASLIIGERAMVAASHRGGPLWLELTAIAASAIHETDVALSFGAAEPHLVAMYIDHGQRPYAPRNFFSEESGYLVPNFSLPKELAAHGVRREWRTGAAYQRLPQRVQEMLAGTGTVRSANLTSEDDYWRELRHVLSGLPSGTALLFDGLDDRELRGCTARSVIIDCALNDQIVKRDGTARNMYIVLSGRLEARDGKRCIRSLSPGDLFAESGFILGTGRTADVFVVVDNTRILSLSNRALRSFMTDHAESGTKILTNLTRILASRLADAENLTG